MSFTKPEPRHIKSKVASDTVMKSSNRMGMSTANSYKMPKVFKKGSKGKKY